MTKPRHPEKVNKPYNPIKKKPSWIRSKVLDTQTFFNTKAIVNKNVFIMNDGDDMFIAKKAIHRMAASPDGVTFIEVQRGECREDDIVRLQDDYGRVDKQP